jgi:methionine-rich copper-binding protein CopC
MTVSDGNGIDINASGVGINTYGISHGIYPYSTGGGHGIYASAQGAAGSGIWAESHGTHATDCGLYAIAYGTLGSGAYTIAEHNGHGWYSESEGNGDGIRAEASGTGAPIRGNITGSLSGSVGSVGAGGIASSSFASGATIPRVTLADTLTTNSDKTGYGLSSGERNSIADAWIARTHGMTTLGAELAASGGTGTSPYLVDDEDTWSFDSRTQITSPDILVESATTPFLKQMDFSEPLTANGSIQSVTSVTVADESGKTEPTIVSSAKSADQKKVVITINASAASAGTYTFTVTVLSTDGQSYARKGKLTIQ